MKMLRKQQAIIPKNCRFIGKQKKKNMKNGNHFQTRFTSNLFFMLCFFCLPIEPAIPWDDGLLQKQRYHSKKIIFGPKV